MNFQRGRSSAPQSSSDVVFATWRLIDSLPGRSDSSQVSQPLSEGQKFLGIDRMLDEARTGPVWFENQLIAESIAQTLLMASRQWHYCKLFAWVIMPNHVHVLMQPERPLQEVSRAIRKTGARMANEHLGRSGCTFWHENSYDYWVRDQAELQRIASYIESNPVTAGLAAQREQWHWSSAFPQLRGKAARMLDVDYGLLSLSKPKAGPILAA
jgi:REP element-mobilizing transposase RayT